MLRRRISHHKYCIVSGLALVVFLGAVSGCAKKPLATSLISPYPRAMTVALMPVLNFSGTEELDTLKVTDLLYSELQQVEGLAVVPVNRVLAQMTEDRMTTISGVGQLLTLAEHLGADAIVVCGVTEYDPYYPPRVGLAMQIFDFTEDPSGALHVDPVKLERSPTPTAIKCGVADRYMPKSQVQRIYNGRDRRIVAAVKRFAKSRGTGQSPYGWQFYMRSQTHYIRFVGYQAISELLSQERERLAIGSLSDGEEYH